MDPITLRAIERILAVAIGGVAIVLGYRLFLAVPEQRDASGTFRLPWNIAIGLTRVGPGVFFALFGAAVVGYSLHGAIDVSQSADGSSRIRYEVRAEGALPANEATINSLPARRLNVGSDIEFLNTLGRMLRADLDDAERRAVRDHATALKLAVMERLWAADWGDATAFRDWAERGATDPVPAGSDKAAQFYRIGLEGTP